MSSKTIVQNILACSFPEWRETACLPPDLVLMCLDYLVAEVVLYYPDTDDTIKSSSGVLFNGKRYGKWTEWHKNGQRKTITHYVHGVEHGKSKSWRWDGDLEYKGSYVDGKEDGRCVTYHSETKTGQIHVDQEYSKGDLHGVSRIYYSYGVLKSETHYKNGEKHGPDARWSACGNLYKLSMYKHGEMHGECKTWDFYGMLSSQVTYKKGKKHGESIEWEDGKLVDQGYYENDEKVGVWKEQQTKVVLVRYKKKLPTRPKWRV